MRQNHLVKLACTCARWPHVQILSAGLLALLLITSCSDPLGFGDSDWKVSITTNSSAYQLEHRPGIFTTPVRVTIRNYGARTVYLHRICGIGDSPARQVRRTTDDRTPVSFGGFVCTSEPLRPPIPIHPGDEFVDEAPLASFESPSSIPPVTSEMRTGTFEFVYSIQKTDRVEGWDPIGLIPIRQRLSNEFVVEAPF